MLWPFEVLSNRDEFDEMVSNHLSSCNLHQLLSNNFEQQEHKATTS